jgi:hypothetical protein
MDEPRLKAKLRVQAMLRQATVRGCFGAVLTQGDPDAGAILAVLRGRDGLAVLSQTRTGEGELAWLRATGADPVDQATADAYVARQRGYDVDLWVVEFETPALDLPFDGILAKGPS